jgi:hypothetical protein
MRGLLFSRGLTPAALLLLSAGLLPQNANAHGFAGDRFFPATIVVDDPAVADELSLPTVAAFKNGDNSYETDISAELSKRITEHFGVSISPDWTHLSRGGNGFQNLETSAKYQLITDAKTEFMLSVGFSVEWANTGAASVGAENFNTYSPQIFFGKGLGDLPEEYDLIRPFAITGQVGYAVPQTDKAVTLIVDPDTQEIDRDIDRHAHNLEWGLTLQYSLPYLNSHVKAIEGDGAEFLRRLIPLVEASFVTPVSNFSGPQVTTGTINPGVIWSGQELQLGVEAVIPLNRESGRGVGVIGQLHFYLDDIFPNSIGKPIFEAEK